MSYVKMIEKNLAENGMGLGALTTEVEELMFLEDDLRLLHFFEKDLRSLRRNNTFHKKVRLQRVAKFALDEITEKGKVKDSGYRTYLKGDKVWSRKVRHTRFEEPLTDETEEVIGEITLDEDDNSGWKETLRRRNYNGEVVWGLGLKLFIQTNKGLREAREAIDERVDALNAEKKRLLEEYADKIEAINAEIRAINNR